MKGNNKAIDTMVALRDFSIIPLFIVAVIYFADAPDEKVISQLEKEWYTNIELGFYRPFSCINGESNRDSFRARDNKGREISGVVCSSAGGGKYRVILDD